MLPLLGIFFSCLVILVFVIRWLLVIESSSFWLFVSFLIFSCCLLISVYCRCVAFNSLAASAPFASSRSLASHEYRATCFSVVVVYTSALLLRFWITVFVPWPSRRIALLHSQLIVAGITAVLGNV